MVLRRALVGVLLLFSAVAAQTPNTTNSVFFTNGSHIEVPPFPWGNPAGTVEST